LTDSAADIAVVSTELQMFSGQLPTLVLMAAPQQGKTSAAADFIAWLAGRHAASRK
jgi:hypothetical protein